MLTKRVIPCLDVHAGQVVKGIRFENLRELGDPVELASRYARQGADELVFLDISATIEDRAATLAVVSQVARAVSVPLTMGGGIRSVEDAREALRAGADKVGVNSAAVQDPALLTRLAEAFGSQCVVLAVDARRSSQGWEVVTHAGRRGTGKDAVAWCREGQDRGAGEILLTSIDQDGTRGGYDVELLERVGERLHIPLVASGGAGAPEHLVTALKAGADAVLAASIFHEGQYSVGQVKRRLAREGVPVRLDGEAGDWIQDIRWNADGLVPVVVSAADGARMLGYANREALERTTASGYLWLYSRSRERLWQKGESSGNRQRVEAMALDCDADTVLVHVVPEGPTCHTGMDSCFFDGVWPDPAGWSSGRPLPAEIEPEWISALRRLEATIQQRLQDRPEGSYVVKLADDRDLARRKVGEEAVEFLLATAAMERNSAAGQAQERRHHSVAEAADLLFHWLVLLKASGLTMEEVAHELTQRVGARRPAS